MYAKLMRGSTKVTLIFNLKKESTTTELKSSRQFFYHYWEIMPEKMD